VQWRRIRLRCLPTGCRFGQRRSAGSGVGAKGSNMVLHVQAPQTTQWPLSCTDRRGIAGQRSARPCGWPRLQPRQRAPERRRRCEGRLWQPRYRRTEPGRPVALRPRLSTGLPLHATDYAPMNSRRQPVASGTAQYVTSCTHAAGRHGAAVQAGPTDARARDLMRPRDGPTSDRLIDDKRCRRQ